jgi:NAD(P)-dependent dehydrogenase (short-subunit alcohol dehydrogenase family)
MFVEVLALVVAVGVLGGVLVKAWIGGEWCTHRPDLRGKVAVVTGTTSGMGVHVADALAALGATVITGNHRSTAATTDGLTLELADLRSVEQFAKGVLDRCQAGGVDILVLNAGVMCPPAPRETVQGFERTWGTNFVGHFHLARLLLPAVARAHGRVVTLVSRTHWDCARAGGIQWESVARAGAGAAQRKEVSGMLAYGQSKLALVMFARELHRRCAPTVQSYLVDPGNVLTEITRYYPAWLHWLWKAMRVGKQPKLGAQTTLHCATAPLAELTSGAYYQNNHAALDQPSHIVTEALATKLWETTADQIEVALGRKSQQQH